MATINNRTKSKRKTSTEMIEITILFKYLPNTKHPLRQFSFLFVQSLFAKIIFHNTNEIRPITPYLLSSSRSHPTIFYEV